jgi:RES domain-containing protein
VPGHAGRYHRTGGTRTWYGSSSEDAAWAEFFRHYAEEDIDPFEVIRRIGTISFEGLVALDLTDAAIRDALGLTEDDLIADDHAVCQRLADRAREAGFEAILAPSAGLHGATTLAVFGDIMSGRKTAVHDRGRQRPPIRIRKRLSLVRRAADRSAESSVHDG